MISLLHPPPDEPEEVVHLAVPNITPGWSVGQVQYRPARSALQRRTGGYAPRGEAIDEDPYIYPRNSLGWVTKETREPGSGVLPQLVATGQDGRRVNHGIGRLYQDGTRGPYSGLYITRPARVIIQGNKPQEMHGVIPADYGWEHAERMILPGH